jgi:polyhydroxyalkanoate synthesis repressor PhaR
MNDESPTAGNDPSAGGREPKVIKRYTNRKLYDTVESRYVTLDEIAEMIKAGAEVKIVDNRTKEDLTSVTLAQIIFEEEKKTSKMSLEMLRDLIRRAKELVQTSQDAVSALQRKVDERVRAAMEGMSNLGEVKRSLDDISRRIEGLEKRLDELSKK